MPVLTKLLEQGDRVLWFPDVHSAGILATVISFSGREIVIEARAPEDDGPVRRSVPYTQIGF